MATFFDKLNGSRGTSVATVDLSATKDTARKTAVRTQRAESQTPMMEPDLPEPEEVSEDPIVENQVEENDEEEGELTVDIYDKGDSIVIQSTVAGVRPEHLDVSITDDTVSIRGRRMQHERVEDEHYYYKELFWGTFARSVILPEEIEQDEAEASLQHGLLTVKLPKKRKGVTQKLKVKLS